MKYIAPFTPVFTPLGATLDFSAYAGQFSAAQLMAVVDITADQTIFLPGVPGLGISALSANGLVLTLQSNVAALGAADVLQVFYDDGQGLGTPASNLALQSGASGMNGALSSLYAAFSGQRFVSGSQGAVVRAVSAEDLLTQIRDELKLMNVLLLQGFGLPEDLNDLRSEVAEDNLS